MRTHRDLLDHVVDELIGLWPTVCRGFSNEYFRVSPAVNQDGTLWVLFHYDYTDEVGSSTYASVAVPVAKLRRDIETALSGSQEAVITVPINGIAVAPQRPGYVNDPRVPTGDRPFTLSVVLVRGGHVLACTAEGTRFERGVPLFPPPVAYDFRCPTTETVRLVVSRKMLAAARVSFREWHEYA